MGPKPGEIKDEIWLVNKIRTESPLTPDEFVIYGRMEHATSTTKINKLTGKPRRADSPAQIRFGPTDFRIVYSSSNFLLWEKFIRRSGDLKHGLAEVLRQLSDGGVLIPPKIEEKHKRFIIKILTQMLKEWWPE